MTPVHVSIGDATVRRAARRGHGAGMTLVEMLVAMTLTLIMMAAVAQIFGMLGQGVNASRSATELTERMRSVAYRVRQDLRGVTADLAAIGRPELAQGYFEIIEGPDSDEFRYLPNLTLPKSARDGDPALVAYQAATGSDDRLVGDCDDLLLLTIRGDERDFRGKLGPVGIRSPYAEVMWYCTPTPNSSSPVTYTLHRRQRVVQSHPGAGDFGAENRRRAAGEAELYAYTDVSCRLHSGYAYPNSLGDLTKRENRFLRVNGFPYRFDVARLNALLNDEAAGARFGDDVVLTNVIAFDVRVYDPGAPVQVHGPPHKPLPAAAVMPGDPGYVRPPTPLPAGVTIPSWGAYVDLGYGIDPVTGGIGVPYGVADPPSLFFGVPDGRSGLGPRSSAEALTIPRVFCTWSSHYESNFVDEDGRWGPDQGVNGIDDDDNNLIDDPPEAETAPPYPLALRGVEVRVRCYEPASRQVRQMTVRQSFD